MNKFAALLAVALAAVALSTACALDTVKLIKGPVVTGRMTVMTPTEVETTKTGGIGTTTPVNEIATIYWEDSPPPLRDETGVRAKIKEGDFQAALDALEGINMQSVNRKEVKQEIEYLAAYCKAKLALGGQGDVVAAGREMNKWANEYKNNYHWLPANEVIGDCLVAAGLYPKAIEAYTRVGEAPWPDFKMRAAAAIGRALFAQGQTDAALKKFDEVLAMNIEGELAANQKLNAQVGRTRCLIALKKTDEAIKALNAIIDKADQEQKDLLAQAHNALGTAYRAAGKPKEARTEFLHTHLMYNTNPDAHAEAVANLRQLWRAESRPEREAEMKQLLDDRYPNSPWTKKSGG